MKLSAAAFSMALVSTLLSSAQACYPATFKVSRIIGEDHRDIFSDMYFHLSVQSDKNTYTASIKDGKNGKIERVSTANGAVQFAALWRDKRFDFYYNGWYNFHGNGRERWFEDGFKEIIVFDGCVN